MPFTFLAHQASVLPLKLGRPAWFSGIAMVVGSMAPDFEYFIRGEPLSTVSHTLAGQFVFCLPLTVLLVLVVERVLAPVMPGHLPDAGPFHVHDYAALANARRDLTGWFKLVVSALAGSFSHIAWDGFTHGHGWAVARLPVLSRTAFVVLGHDVPVFKLLQHGSTLVGAAVTLAVLLVVGRRRLLPRWRGPVENMVEPTRRSYALLAGPAVVAAGLGVVVAVATGARDGDLLRLAVCVFLRTTSFVFIGACVGAVLARKVAPTFASEVCRQSPA